MKKYKVISFVLVVCMVLTMMPAGVFAETGANDSSQAIPAEQAGLAFADMTGHWSAQAVSKWAGLGIVKGDSRGFRPDDSITRAELAVILDNLMDYQSKSGSTFTDVKSGAWYADAVAKANAAGILNGDGAGHALPNAKVTREQAAVMLARAFGVDENAGEKTSFKDASFISKWAKTLVFGMEENKYIGGMGNGNFSPQANITRAQVVTIIDNAVAAYYIKAGVYTDNVTPKAEGANCVAIVKTSGVILKSAVVSGDLIVAEGVDKGDFTLDGTTVSGKLITRGGGENSVHIINGADVKGKVTIEKVDGVVRIVSDGVVIATLEADAEVILEGEFTNVTVAEGASVEVRGKVAKLDVAGKAEIKATKDSRIENMIIEAGAKGTNLDIDKSATINKLEAKADMTTSGAGAPKSVTGTGTVTVRGEGVTNGGGGGGGGNPGNSGNPTDKRSVSFKDGESVATYVIGSSIYSNDIYFTGKNTAGETCSALGLGNTSVKCDGTLLTTTQCSKSVNYDYINITGDYLESLNEGKHTVEIRISAADGKEFVLNYYIYIVPATTTVLYDQPQSGSLKIYQFTGNFGKGTRGAEISSGGSMTLGSGCKMEIELAGLPLDKRVKSVTITKSYYGYTQTDDYTNYFISYDLDMLYAPQGTVIVQVVTEDVPSSLPEISGVEFYLDYNETTDTYSNPVTTTVPAMESPGDVFTPLFAKVLFADGKKSSFVNYLWEVETDPGTYSELFTTNYNYMSLYEAGTNSGYRYRVTASGYSKQSQGTASATIFVMEPLHPQGIPPGLTTSSITASTAVDGMIGNTTTDMEYKPASANESAYVTCMAGVTAGLAAGSYHVRLKAKPGYTAGYPTTVTINQPQAAPTGLTGEAPASLSEFGKIKGTTELMEHKKATDPESSYSTCFNGGTTVFNDGTYSVRFAKRAGYDESPAVTITVPAYAKSNQAAPTGLSAQATTSSKSSDGKILNVTTDMEFKLASDTGDYQSCSGDQNYLAGGIYLVRYKATNEKNASPAATVTVPSPAAKSIATLSTLSVIYDDGSIKFETISEFNPSTFSYNVTLSGVNIENTFELNTAVTSNSYATRTTSPVTLDPGQYTTELTCVVTSEDGNVQNTYTVNLTVERRTCSASIDHNSYAISGDTEPVITMSFTDQDGADCSLEELIDSGGTLYMKNENSNTPDLDANVIDPQYYTVDAAYNKITIKENYFIGKTNFCTFKIFVKTAGNFIYRVFPSPYVTIE